LVFIGRSGWYVISPEAGMVIEARIIIDRAETEEG